MTAELFTPYQVKDVKLKNRIVMSPMCMYSCEEEDGIVTDWHLAHYTSRAVGQVGLIMIEATAVTPEGRITSRDLGIWNDEHVEGLQKLVNQVKAHGSKTAIQLAHAGRKATVDGTIYAPSAIAFDDESKTPAEMTKEDIERTIEAFKEGAKRSKQAGFDIIEIHGAHGYLIHQFLSPLSNKRTDEYGGSAENRYRFLQQTINSVKEVWDGPLFVRVSATDYAEGGLTIDDHVTFAKWMKEQGVDLIDVSSGALVHTKINVYPGYQVPFAEKSSTKQTLIQGLLV